MKYGDEKKPSRQQTCIKRRLLLDLQFPVLQTTTVAALKGTGRWYVEVSVATAFAHTNWQLQHSLGQEQGRQALPLTAEARGSSGDTFMAV